MKAHQKFECGQERKFPCPYETCDYKAKLKHHLKSHLFKIHGGIDTFTQEPFKYWIYYYLFESKRISLINILFYVDNLLFFVQ